MKIKAKQPSPFFSIPDAARIAKMHEKTLYLLVKAGIIPAYGRPGTLRVKLSDVLPRWVPTPSKNSIPAEQAERARRWHLRWAEKELAKARALCDEYETQDTQQCA